MSANERATVPFVVGDSVVVFRDVPAEVCRSCHEPYLAGPVVDRITDHLARLSALSLRTRIARVVAGIALATLALSLLWIGQRGTYGGSASAARPAIQASSALAAAPAQSGVPGPTIHCETPTPGPWPTSWALLPDLVVRGMAVDHAPCRTCSTKGPYYGVVVEVGNQGGEAPPFVVEVNGRRQAVDRLPGGKSVNLWFQGKPAGETVAMVDPEDSVAEIYPGNDNNVLRGILPTPTWEPDAPTCTPEPPSTSMPDLAIGMMSIALQPNWACGTPPVLGLHAEVKNGGFGTAGPFVVVLNGTPRAVGGLGEAGSRDVFAPGYRSGSEQEVVVDPENQVLESDESNNIRREMVPIPTLPFCPTMTATATGTAGTGEPPPTASSTGVPTEPPEPASRCLLPFVGNLWTWH